MRPQERFKTQAEYEAWAKTKPLKRIACAFGWHDWVTDVPGEYTGYVRCACCAKRDFEFLA